MIWGRRRRLYTLAGEYVLGTLTPEKTQKVAREARRNSELRAAIHFWHQRLHHLTDVVAPVQAPDAVWQKILNRTVHVPVRQTPARQFWNSLPTWRWTTLATTAASLYFAAVLLIQEPAPGAQYIAVLHAPDQTQAAWAATMDEEQGLFMHTVADSAPPEGQSFELWAIPPGAERPESLGVIPHNGQVHLSRLPASVRPSATLAVSVEPPHGSPTGLPTGPVVFVGTVVAAR